MDTRQPANKRKRGSTDENSAKNCNILTEGDTQEIAELKSRELETNPLKIGHILEKIYSFLDANSIKNARRVNKLWSVEGAKVLITKCYVRIPADLRVLKLFRRSIKMDKFKAFLSLDSNVTPKIPNIMVTSARDMDVWKSLTFDKMQVKFIKFNIVADKDEVEDTAATFLDTLDLFPNIKHLSSPDVSHFGHRKNSSIMNLLACIMSSSWKDGNPLVISNLTLYPFPMQNYGVIEKFADCRNIMLEELTVSSMFSSVCDMQLAESRVVDIMNKLLSTSRNTLKKLTLYDCQHYLPRLNFKCMTALTTLHFHFNLKNVDALFNDGFQFSEKVPKLEQISMEFTGPRQRQGPNFLSSLFKNNGEAPSVKRLSFWDNYLDIEISPLFQIFPNVKEFKAVGFSIGMFHSLWTHGKNLKKLDIHVATYLSELTGSLVDLDLAFTGFAPETVEIIKNSPNWTPGPAYVGMLRVNPSILNLKELKILTINIRGYNLGNLPKRMLSVAGSFAFNLLPSDARVIIHVRDSEPEVEGFAAVFEEISKLPNVTIIQ